MPQTCNFIEKENLTQVFFCEFCEIFKNSFFYRTPRVDGFVFWSSFDSWDHSFTKYAKFSEKLTFLTLWCTQVWVNDPLSFLFFLVGGYLLPLIFKLIQKWNIFNFESQFRSIFRTFSNIQDGGFCRNLLVFDYFCKNLHLRYLVTFWVCLWTLFILDFFGRSSARGGSKGPPFHRILWVKAIEMKFGTHVYHVILQLFTLKFFWWRH